MPFRLDRNRFGGGILIYVWEYIPSKQLTKQKLLDNIEGIFVEINLRKVKWSLFGIYHLPRQRAECFLKQVDYVLDIKRKIYDKLILLEDFS